MRYAVYYVPEETDPLHDFGVRVLGYDLASGQDVQPMVLPAELAPLARAAAAGPAHYGFHATLKAPFHPAAGVTQDDVLSAMETLAAQLNVLDIGALDVRRIQSFLALAPVAPPPALGEFAMTCVRRLDHLRAPANREELAKRRAAFLSPRQEELMARWGYPYVEEQFRYHMTLTGSLNDSVALQFETHLRACYAEIRAPLRINSICLCIEESATQRLKLLRRFPLKD